jgi:hypothetical protein
MILVVLVASIIVALASSSFACMSLDRYLAFYRLLAGMDRKGDRIMLASGDSFVVICDEHLQ